ncbi:putative 1-phosphatidylinositol-3-phosphate 5-kinase FAB1D isoform X3 [Nicotiana tabacum]|uniref:1-phosphatidylinositol-3-phosphate 5-kinase FAB1D isoform X3 n=1 Tax=Nicotiana tabacum TaxID=4097 RepID=A0AC58TVG9_TOBAC
MKKLENENSVQFDGGSSGGFSGDASSDGRVYIDECSTDSSQEECCSTMRTRRDAELMNGSCEETKSRKIEGDDDDESGIPSSYELDQFWEPPEPECCDDDMEGSVANYDDDECDNDLNWGKPTSLINLGEEGLWSYKFKEEKQKALEEVMNGKLKSLVNDLLKSFGVNSSACDNWVDIVTSLSWEAASFVKPDSAEGKAMDPNRYVKIKCIRTGSPSQSQFIRGLVFKKHAAHKHMPTKFEKARLLLIEGAVGLSSSELSSFHAMKEEKDNVVKSIIEILERYQPNVILVEETVSRDIQESILKKGWTLVFDMKKHRLERVAICTVSPTLSSEILSGHKLRQCDSFHFQRFVEEHDTSADGGKRPSKTLMFIEGCPTHLGCTKLPCTNCDGSPEDHIFYYAHYNKLLAIQVRSLPTDKGLPGESEGKIWMWSRCGRCKFQTGSSKSTKRVLVSTGSRGFSFGKFLELSFSNTSLFNRLSSGCGHSLHRDFLYFFGLGRMVAMFKYSTITTYSVSLPPEKLEFSSSVNGEFLKKELEDVYKKGTTMFLDVEKALKAIEPRFVGTVLNLQGSMRKFSEIEKMLKEERTQFEIDIQNAALDGNQDVVVFKLLTLNRIRLELLLESCVWDRRLHSLLSSDCTAADPKSVDQKVDTLPSINTINDWEQQEKGSVKGDSNGAKIYPERDDRALEDVADLKSKLVESSCAENNNWTETTGGSCGDVLDADHHRKSNVESSAEANGLPIKEICVDTHDYRQDEPSTLSAFCDGAESTTAAKVNGSEVSLQDVTVNSDLSDHCLFGNESNLQLNLPSSIQLETDKRIIVDADAGGAHDFNHSQSRSLSSIFSNTENDEGWWTPFSEIWRQYLEDLQRGHLPKLGSITNHDVESTTYKLITHEGAKLHIPLGSDKFIVSDYEDEFSSIIACALALLKDLPIESEDLGGDGRKDRGTDAKAYESSQGVMRIFSVASPHLSSTGSLDLTRFHSSNISEETRTASLDGGLDLLNSSVSFTVHPEVSMGLGKLTGKYKYSVLCLYASQFRRLRDRWCTSEVDYIASLSRCRSWDAKGGKSKSLFAKTVDDRFIIKEIKRAEFDSFLKFATQYFEYMDQCHEKRNQTCLAKILGIYQVNVRPRGGKETRHDLMVMENLSFNRSTTRQYDLKGALHARFSSAGNGAGDVLLDQNFVNDMNVSPLYVGTRSKRDLQRAVWNDCTFLRSINVMDYSLLVGVDSQRCELVCGIIDYLRQYTWDKQLENWVKSSLVVPKNQLPTIVSPKEYYKRFRKFIDTHFLSVPDHWCSQKSSNPCKPYGTISGIASPQAESDGDSDQPKLTGEGEYEDANSTAQEKQNGFTT